MTLVTVLLFTRQIDGVGMANQDMQWPLKMISVRTGTLSYMVKESIY
jgi:hypothetical protein